MTVGCKALPHSYLLGGGPGLAPPTCTEPAERASRAGGAVADLGHAQSISVGLDPSAPRACLSHPPHGPLHTLQGQIVPVPPKKDPLCLSLHMTLKVPPRIDQLPRIMGQSAGRHGPLLPLSYQSPHPNSSCSHLVMFTL